MKPEWQHTLWIYPCNDFRRQCFRKLYDWTLRAPWGDEYRVRLAISIGYESFETVVDVLMITSVDDLDFLISLNFEVNSITWDILATEIIMPTINNGAITLTLFVLRGQIGQVFCKDILTNPTKTDYISDNKITCLCKLI